ncbi:MAG: universal stress protein [Pseudomonadota bacterium]
MRRFKNILVVCDAQSAFEHTYERVSWLARTNGATVTLVDTIKTETSQLAKLMAALPGRSASDLQDEVHSVHQANLAGLAARFEEDGIRVSTDVLTGTPFIEIIKRVLNADHDLVIKGAQRSPSGPFFGGLDMHLMRKCPCPVWVLNSAAEPRSRRMLAAVDPTSEETAAQGLNQMVIELATSLARQDGAKLDVINVWELEGEATLRHSLAKVPQDEIDQLVRAAGEQSAARLKSLTDRFAEFDDLMRVLHIKGVAEDVICEHITAEEIDTVIMGSLARTGVAGLFIGNTAESILSRVSASVLTVKAQGFVSPVQLGNDPAGAAH